MIGIQTNPDQYQVLGANLPFQDLKPTIAMTTSRKPDVKKVDPFIYLIWSPIVVVRISLKYFVAPSVEYFELPVGLKPLDYKCLIPAIFISGNKIWNKKIRDIYLLNINFSAAILKSFEFYLILSRACKLMSWLEFGTF
jgi:hypothetical protein